MPIRSTFSTTASAIPIASTPDDLLVLRGPRYSSIKALSSAVICPSNTKWSKAQPAAAAMQKTLIFNSSEPSGGQNGTPLPRSCAFR
jgi:hypothetical protein